MENIVKSHLLAKDLLDRDDGYVTVMVRGEEYMVKTIKRVTTYANMDDSCGYWTIIAEDSSEGNIKR